LGPDAEDSALFIGINKVIARALEDGKYYNNNKKILAIVITIIIPPPFLLLPLKHQFIHVKSKQICMSI
jgi:hypothetical protein